MVNVKEPNHDPTKLNLNKLLAIWWLLKGQEKQKNNEAYHKYILC